MSTRFLIADRDPVIREGCRRYLTARGFEVATVGNALQCHECLQQTAPEVLILDPDLLWGGGDGILDCFLDRVSSRAMVVILVNGHSHHRLPDHLQAVITGRLDRPQGLHELEHFVDRIETLVPTEWSEGRAESPLAVERIYG